MKKIVRLTESDLIKLVKRVLKEQSQVKPFKKNWKGSTVKTCFDFEYLKMIADKNGVVLKKSSEMCGPFVEGESTEGNYNMGLSYPNPKPEPCLTVSSKNGHLTIDLLQKEPLNIVFNMQLGMDDIKKLKSFTYTDEGSSTVVRTNFDDLRRDDTRRLNNETPETVWVWFEDRNAGEVEISCGDYEKILTRLGRFAALVRFLGPNFKTDTWNFQDN